MNDIFFNSVGRLRSGWRVSIFIFAYLVLTVMMGVIFIALASLFKSDYGSFFETTLAMFLQHGISFVVATLLGFGCIKLLENLPLGSLGWAFHKGWFKDFLLGSVVGFFSIALTIGIEMSFGGISFSFNSSADVSSILITLGVTLLIFIVGAANEEVLFRGYIFQTLSRANLSWLAIILTSVFFGYVHTGNPNFTTLSLFNTILAGVWLGFAYLKTRSLWFVFGLHLFWNWFQGSVFGISVSGLSQITPHPLLKSNDFGPKWLTGGEYGVEAGVACTVALIISTLAILVIPFIKPTEEMYELTSKENPNLPKYESPPTPPTFS